MVTPQQWVQGARPRTLAAAVSPVAAGTGLAAYSDSFDALLAALALVVALAFQVGVNYANDYSDGIRGTDEERVGPMRLTASGVATPAQVKYAAFVSFGVGAVAGLAIVVLTDQWWLLLVGAACIAAAWFYTGGRTPYGYRGLGEVSVFVFFGLVATVGTAYIQVEELSWLSVLVASGVGLLACALLVVNNLRDIPTDAVSGKRTLAVRLGDASTRRLYVGLLAASLVVVIVAAIGWTPWALLALVAFIPAAPPIGAVVGGASGPALIPVLQSTALIQLGYGLSFGLGLSLA
ncbi:MAG TPA: 1,4-dihydroxy-2-naphthoate polyprenyltransferase [Actinomycetes bacterium]|nr:1,4-dihydroxy-2-naphthoate polyprenyltransferase [Actinomycetes bacterium]